MNNNPHERKVALITYANDEIGKVTAQALASQGYHVFLACQSQACAMQVIEGIRLLSDDAGPVEFLELDLADLDSVRRCAEDFLDSGSRLDLLVANAEIIGKKGLTRNGLELAFGICHMGHFLLVNLLLERMKETPHARIVVVSSKAHQQASSIDFNMVCSRTATASGQKEYSTAKLANLLFTRELGERLKGMGISTYAVHSDIPYSEGEIQPTSWRRRFSRTLKSPKTSAKTILYCATAPKTLSESGLYYEDCNIATPSSVAMNNSLARELWEFSERYCGISAVVHESNVSARHFQS